MTYSPVGSSNIGGGRFPLFVCGMHTSGIAECDGLANHVLPDLDEHCTRQRLALAACNVREIAARHPHRDLVGACIDDIRHRQCYVVGVIGAGAGASLNGRKVAPQYPWQVPEDTSRLSAAELDLMESVSANPSLGNRCFIYVHESLRRENPITMLPVGGDARLKRLLQGLAGSAATVRTYREAGHLCRLVCEDIGSLIETSGARDDAGAFVADELAAHAAFAQSRREVYVPIGDYTNRIATLMERTDTVGCRIAIVGESGAGKSAFLAHWSSEIRTRRPDAIVIEHYVGASPHGADEMAVLRHVLAQLRNECSINEPVPTDLSGMIGALRTWPAYAGDREVIVVLDAIDQLAESEQGPVWLSARALPANLVLVVSARPYCAAYSEIAEPLWTLIEMAPLTVDDRWRLLDGYLESDAGRLPQWLKSRVSQADAITTPLLLRAVIEGLRVEGGFASVESRLQELLSAASIEALFGTILDWLEADPAFGEELVEEVLCLLRASHRGLSLDELADLLDPARLRNPPGNNDGKRTVAVTALVRRLGSFISLSDGLLRFFHDSLGDTVEQRYMKAFGLRRRKHEKLARYFATHASAARRTQEAPWQWNQARRWTELRKCVADIPMFMSLSAEEHRWDLLHYWQSMRGGASLAGIYLESLNSLHPAPPLEDIVRILQRLGEMFLYAARYDDAIIVLRRALSYPGTNALSIRTCVLLSAAYHHLGQFADVEKLLAPLVHQSSREPDEQAGLLEAMERLANLYCARHAYADAGKVLNRVLPLSDRLYGPDHQQTLSIITLMGLVAIRNGFPHAAEHMLRPVLETCRRLYPSDLASALGNLAAALEKQGRWAEAMELVKEAIAISEKIYPSGHPETAYMLNNLAYMLRLTGQFDQSEQAYLKALKILTSVFGNYHPEVAICRNNLSTLYTMMKRFDDAETCYRQALDIYVNHLKFAPDNVRVISVELNLAWLQMQRENYLKAAELFAAIIPRRIAVSGVDHPETQHTIENFRKVAAAARLDDPGNERVIDVEVKLAELEMELGNYAQAIGLFGELIPRMTRVLGADHPKTLHAIESHAKARAADDDARRSQDGDEPEDDD